MEKKKAYVAPSLTTRLYVEDVLTASGDFVGDFNYMWITDEG